MSNPEMIQLKLTNVFGNCTDFTLDICEVMKKRMLDDLNDGVKEEYMSDAGLAMLYDRSGGKLTENMMNIIVNVRTSCLFVFLRSKF